MTDRHAEEMGSPGGDRPQESEQEQLVHEIEETRAELGDTVDALAEKADVKARVSEKFERATSQVAHTAEQRPLQAIAVALGLGMLIGRALRRR